MYEDLLVGGDIIGRAFNLEYDTYLEESTRDKYQQDTDVLRGDIARRESIMASQSGGNKNLFIIIGGVIVLLGGGFYILKKKGIL